YKMNDFATLSWKDASIITVDEVMIQMIFEIKHRELSQLKGLVRFDGQILDYTNLIKQENNPQCVERAVDQALVVAKSIDGNIIQYFVTGIDGKFVLEELPPTSFKIFISKVGYKEIEATYVGDYETNFAFNNNFYLDKEVNEVQEDRNHTIHLNEQHLIISFDDAFELKNIQIFDVFGNSLPILISSYGKSVSIDVSYYSMGVYFARIITDKDRILTKFIIVR
ncbi:MAG: T9SS type A sorting domain-containing protein, partial [Candidatus Kapaibacteriota bacterium]